MEKQFDKQAFETEFNKSLTRLARAEKITKTVLLELSRSVLSAFHATEDVAYINRLVAVLTPMNKATAILYFQEFSGFKFDDKEKTFGKKDKKRYDEVKAKALEFLADPHNNIWTWASRNVEMKKKDFDINQVKTVFSRLMKQADEEGFTAKDVLAQVFAAGVELDAVVAAMEATFEVKVN